MWQEAAKLLDHNPISTSMSIASLGHAPPSSITVSLDILRTRDWGLGVASWKLKDGESDLDPTKVPELTLWLTPPKSIFRWICNATRTFISRVQAVLVLSAFLNRRVKDDLSLLVAASDYVAFRVVCVYAQASLHLYSDGLCLGLLMCVWKFETPRFHVFLNFSKAESDCLFP